MKLYDAFQTYFSHKIVSVRDFYNYFEHLYTVDVYYFLNMKEKEMQRDFKFRSTMNILITAIVFFVIGWVAAVYVFP